MQTIPPIENSTHPSYSSTEKLSLHERLSAATWWVWIIGDGLILAFVIVAAAVVKFYVPSDNIWQVIVLTIAAVISLLILINMALHQAVLRSWLVTIEDNELRIKSGVIILERMVLPINRIQHVEVHQGPLERIFKILSLRIATAAEVTEIPGLTPDQAERLQTVLINKIKLSTDNV